MHRWGELGKLKVPIACRYVRMCVVDGVVYNVDADTGCLVSHYIIMCTRTYAQQYCNHAATCVHVVDCIVLYIVDAELE